MKMGWGFVVLGIGMLVLVNWLPATWSLAAKLFYTIVCLGLMAFGTYLVGRIRDGVPR